MLVIEDKNGNTEPLLGVKPEAVIRRVINEEYTLSFEVFKNEINDYSYPLVLEDSVVIVEEERFIIKSLMEYPYSKRVTAVHEFFEIIDDFVEFFLSDGMYSINTALEHAFSQTSDWNFVVEDAFNSAYLEGFGDNNPIALLQIILESFGAEYKVSSTDKTVVIKKSLGVETDYQVRFKNNLIEIDKQVDVNNVKTAVKVYYNKNDYGEYENNVIYYSPNRNNYRRTKWEKPLYLDFVNSEQEALNIASTQINDVPVVSINCDFIFLQESGYDIDSIEIGNSFYLIDERLNLFDSARIVAIENYPLDENRTPSVTVSNKRKTIAELPVVQQRKQNTLDKEAVKIKEIYNGASLTDEEGLKISGRNGVIILLNADVGLLMEKDGLRKFYVDTDGNVTFDGRLLITAGDGVTPLLEGFLDEYGGVIKINDDEGGRSVHLGSNSDSGRRGGIIELFEDGVPRAVLNARDAPSGSGGFLELKTDTQGYDVKLTTYESALYGARLDLGNQTYLSSNRGAIQGVQIATLSDINDLYDYIDDQISNIDTGGE